MSSAAQRLRIHFFGRRSNRPVCPLAGALGLGPLARPGGVEADRYDNLARRASELFEVVPDHAAEFWLYAHDVVTASEVDEQLAALSDAPTPRCVFFYSNDDAAPIAVRRPNVALFRTSLMASTRLPHEHAMPALCDDLLVQAGSELVPRPWSEVPTVGFCGFVGSTWKRIGFKALQQRQKVDGLELRERALAALERGRGIRTDFVRRSSFWGGSMSRFHFDEQRQQQVRAEFVRNVLDNDYALCARGKGNFSYRFYEVLSAGRIPVFVNSDCVLPFERQIDWKRHVVWLEEHEIGRAAERIVQYHRQLGPVGFAELQRENRRLWQERLSPEAFHHRALSALLGYGAC
jgi:hypothetical protein